jgi:hypothetical protein
MYYIPNINSNWTFVHIDLFFGRLEGDIRKTSLWFPNPMLRVTFDTPISGVQYADCFGEQVLVPFDLEGNLKHLFGMDFMTPQSKGDYAALPSHKLDGALAEYVEPRNLIGNLLSFREMCDLTTSFCPSRYAVLQQLLSMLRFFHRYAVSHGLQYTIACEMLAYSVQKDRPVPAFATIAVQRADQAAWRELLRNVTRRTTYVVEKHADGSWLHMRLSRQSSARLVVYFVPGDMDLSSSLVGVPDPEGKEKLLGHRPRSMAELDVLLGMCHKCVKCREDRQRVDASQVSMSSINVRNKATNQCLVLLSGKVRLTTCNLKV